MTTFTWEDVLSAIREGKQEIPTATNGIPLVAVNAPFYELMQLMEALTTGYNALILREAENQKKIERIRKLAEANFPASQKNTYNWVRAEDRPPEKSGEYYTYGSNMGVYPLHYSAENKLWNAYDTQTEEEALEHAVFGITHWFERPKAPVVPEPIPHEED